MTQTPIITLNAVEKYYTDYHALRGIDAVINQGEFFSLLGPSGCGKTTLLRAIAGFEDLSAGQIRIDGQDMQGVPPNRRPTNLVFQSYAIFPHLSVAENVGFGLRKSDMSASGKRRAIADALDMVRLGDFGARAAHALSGGQRQRVALARALILKPKVLLLDEPLSALDKKMREQMQSELRRLQRQVGITFILVTHDQEEALIMSDRVAVMFDGEIAQLSDPQTLYRRPNSRRVGQFIGMMNFLPAQVLGQTSHGAKHGAKVAIQGLGHVNLGADQCPNGMESGQAKIGLRPETLTILPQDAQADTRATQAAIIEEVTYYGDMTYYDVRLPDASGPVSVAMRNESGLPVWDRGARVSLVWDADAMVLFR
jgi:spermidine/putrescine transport system ATP-binding protein